MDIETLKDVAFVSFKRFRPLEGDFWEWVAENKLWEAAVGIARAISRGESVEAGVRKSSAWAPGVSEEEYWDTPADVWTSVQDNADEHNSILLARARRFWGWLQDHPHAEVGDALAISAKIARANRPSEVEALEL